MTRPTVTMPARLVELGQLGDDPLDGRGRLYFWPGVGIIAPQTRTRDGGWRCELIAEDQARQGVHLGRASMTDADLAALATTMWLDTNDAESYALVWQTRIRQHWPGGRTPAVARVMAEQLRIPGTLTVDLDLSARLHLMRQSGSHPDGLRLILRRLRATGYLIPAGSIMDKAALRLTLMLPEDETT